jgi:hypothetical protein
MMLRVNAYTYKVKPVPSLIFDVNKTLNKME